MKCSVIITYYQRRYLLENTLIALNKQKGMDGEFEVVLGDDGSNDLSEDFLKSLNLTIPLVYVRYERSDYSCMSFIRNRCVEKASGDLIIFIDCDMIVREDFVFQHYQCFAAAKGKPMLQIGFRSNLYPIMLLTVEDTVNRKLYSRDSRHVYLEKYSENYQAITAGWTIAYGCNLSISKELLNQYGGFDENMKGWGAEDVDFSYKLYKNGVKMVYNPNIDAYHQYHEQTILAFDEWKEKSMYLVQKRFDMGFMIYFINNETMDQGNFIKMIQDEMSKGYDNFTAMGNIAIRNFTKLEECSRYIQQKIPPAFSSTITLRNPTIEELQSKIINKEYNFEVFCHKSNIELITIIQTDERFQWVQLYTYE